MSNARGLGPLASSRHGSDQPGLVTSEPLGLVTSESGAPCPYQLGTRNSIPIPFGPQSKEKISYYKTQAETFFLMWI